jgi:hypothetical protein
MFFIGLSGQTTSYKQIEKAVSFLTTRRLFPPMNIEVSI